MASTQHMLLSPAELAYLHSSLSLATPLRPDGRSPTAFRPLSAETDILPGTNGSARICFADGTEAIVGVKAEVDKTRVRYGAGNTLLETELIEAGGNNDDDDVDTGGEDGGKAQQDKREGESTWLEIAVEIPGARDDDASTVYLAEMLSEALLADGEFVKRLWINRRFHWKLYLDILLISPPLSYPLPLLSLTTHLALLATRLPRLKSEADEDPLFDDDWAASTYLYPQKGGVSLSRPPVTLLVMAVGDNIMFDPSKEELAVADVALAISVADAAPAAGASDTMEVDAAAAKRNLRLLSIRTIDPPSRLTPPGVPRATDSTTIGASSYAKQAEGAPREAPPVEGVWKAPRGGAKVAIIGAMIAKTLEKGGVADEVLDGLKAVELG
ncbi:ribosomal protein S5 domain 2-type protein [Coniella lustricola]|uniref:Ribosomal RNA-processing protein 42 n=1 Tax=Coniella lustricola TaxID=2025994 RepID=A0A2T3A3J6_9PEZI|nr:ribosomal protein S5 domain 2-type protein [Coniella lustricola]